MSIDIRRTEKIYEALRDALLREKVEAHHWVGELSASALATATALSALALHGRAAHRPRIQRGINWLKKTRNADGGWGDTPVSHSNISTTSLVVAAINLTGHGEDSFLTSSLEYLDRSGGIAAVIRKYGSDRTFSAPILTNMAIAGLVDWAECPQLPFWLSALPQGLFRYLKLNVVSYALPALIGIGLARFTVFKDNRDFLRPLKKLTVAKSLRLLKAITPESGGYLEATPLTAFVAMGLIAAGRGESRITRKNIEFLIEQQKADGSWQIERDLAVWATTLSVKALGGGDAQTRDWLLSQQALEKHPYVGSAPGAWGWTDSDGSVPDADDTAGALLALHALPDPHACADAAMEGVKWLLGVQNRNGGWPTFCAGWGRLPFDQSCSDITAHALRAVFAWQAYAGTRLTKKIQAAVRKGFHFLEANQRADGSWLPLWFGNENAPMQGNPVYGTAKVLEAYRELGRSNAHAARCGVRFLNEVQNSDGSWGGAAGLPGTLEETALACDSLVGFDIDNSATALEKGIKWLCDQIDSSGWERPAPIGIYFAQLWYYEKMYPLIFCVSAFRRFLAWCNGKQSL